MLRVRLLGDIGAERDGEPVLLSGPHRRLLAFLALHPGPHDRDALAARIWPDLPTARANLRTAVWGLRRALGAEAVEATRTSVALAGAVRDLDEVGPAIAGGDLSPLDATPCAGLDDDWATAARAEHQRRCVAALDALATAAADPADAARWTARRCALTPLDEPAHRVLIERLAAAGDRAGALVAGRELAERLRAELGVGPAPATRAAIARLRGPAAGARLPPGAGSPMFGRAAELATLGAAWSAARTGRGQVVLVTGEAGIGKTRLVGELARRADNAGARVAVGAGVDVGGEAPLQLWEELARALATVVPRPPGELGWPGELGRLAPDLARALGRQGTPPPVAAPELERLRVFDAVLRLVEWAAAGRPVLLVAEDVHRADRASLALSAHIGRRLAALPVLFVLTRRDRPARSDADALLADLAGRGVEVTEVELGPLPGGAVAEVVRTVAALPDVAVDRVVAAADGNPLLAVESARAAAAGRLGGGHDGTAPPANLRSMVRAALGGLPEDARALAEAIAAAGRGLSAAEVAALPGHRTGEAERRVLDSGLLHRAGGGLRYRHALLAEAARADLRDPEGTHLAVALAVEAAAAPADTGPGAHPDARFGATTTAALAAADGRAGGSRAADGRVADGRVADGRAGGSRAADARVADGRVADGRAGGSRAADARVADGRVADGRVADGRVADGRVADGRVADGRVADGRVADGRAADGRVADGRVAAVDAFGGAPVTRPARGSRAAEVAHHLRQAGRDDLAAPRWRQAARHARALGALPEATAFWTEAVRCDPDDAATRLELAEVHAWSGRSADFEREWAAALACLAPAAAAGAWRRRGLLLRTVVCNPAASLTAYRRAAQLLTADAPAALRAQVLVGLAWNEGAAGDADQVDTLLAEVHELVAAGGAAAGVADEVVAETESARLITLIRLGRFAECEAVADAAGAATDRLRRPDLAYVIWIQTTCALTCAGDLEGALRTADRGIAATRDVPVVALPCLAARAHLLARHGRHLESAAVVTELLTTAGRLDSPPLLAVARHDAGLVALAAGRYREAANLLRAALDGDAAVSRPAARLAAAEALACAGDADAAAAEVRRAVLEPVGPADQPWALVPRMARVQGLVARARGDDAEARRRLTEAAEGWRRRRSWVARRAEEYLAALVDLGRPPIVGLVEPDRELARVSSELAELEVGCRDTR